MYVLTEALTNSYRDQVCMLRLHIYILSPSLPPSIPPRILTLIGELLFRSI